MKNLRLSVLAQTRPLHHLKMFNNSPFSIQKFLAYFCITRAIFLAALLSFYLLHYSETPDQSRVRLLPFQIYAIVSFWASCKLIEGLADVSS